MNADRTGEDYADIWSVLVGTAFMLSVMSSTENVIWKNIEDRRNGAIVKF